MQERFREHATHDPFAITPDPNVYVPRAATERARQELLRSACNPAKTSVLIGPPGLGKTLLLHLLAEEVPEDLQTVYLPYAALPPQELCSWSLGLLGLPITGDPIGALQEHSRNLRERGSSLLLLIDDAGSMPIATARWVGDLVQNSGSSVRLAIAASDNPAGNRVIAAIGSNFDVIHLDDPMTESETSKYIEGRLALARVPDSIRARFDDQTVRLLHRISAGIPRRLHSAAAGILQEAPFATEAARGQTPTPTAVASTAPVDTRVEPSTSAQTIGVPSEERRVSNRRAEPAGIAVRVGLDGSLDQKGRRAEDRVEASPPPDESAAEDFEADAPIEAEAFDENEAPEWAPPVPRRALPASRRAILLSTLLVAFAAVSIPIIRSLLSQPHPIAGADRPSAPGGSTRGDLRGAAAREIGESIAVVDPGGLAARNEIGEIRAVAGAEESHGFEPPAVEPPGAEERGVVEPSAVNTPALEPSLVEDLGPFAVQINATPWANIEVDGIDLGETPLANIPLFGGAHSFRARMPDGRVVERTIEIDAERRFISFE